MTGTDRLDWVGGGRRGGKCCGRKSNDGRLRLGSKRRQ